MSFVEDQAGELNGNAGGTQWTPQLDDVKIEYHLKSHLSPQYYRLNNYIALHTGPSEETVPDLEPWKPFRIRLDFKLTELMLDSHMNEGQSTILLSLIRKAIAQPDDFILASTVKLENFWTAARQTRATGVSTGSFK